MVGQKLSTIYNMLIHFIPNFHNLQCILIFMPCVIGKLENNSVTPVVERQQKTKIKSIKIPSNFIGVSRDNLVCFYTHVNKKQILK